MQRRVILGVVVMAVLGLLSGGTISAGGQAGGHHAAHMDKCAKACTMCLRECESCAHHCAHLISQGQKEHLKTLGTCADCADFCAAAARIVSRHGPMATTICESCAKACDTCGKACEGFPNDEHMARCAKACRDCASECRTMIQHMNQGQAK
jgi:hypothetical protein